MDSLKDGEAKPKGRPGLATLPVLLFNEYKIFKEVKEIKETVRKEKWNENFERAKRKSSW